MEINTIHLGDCLELMKLFPDKSIDLVLTDPPYVLNNKGGGKSCLKSIQKLRTGLKEIENGFETKQTLNEFQRVLKKFNAFIFCSNEQLLEIISFGHENGYYTTPLVWHKYNAVPFTNGTWIGDIEYCVHIREKGATFQGNASLKKKVTTLPIETSIKWHPTPKPMKLIEKYIKIGSKEGDLILDCFSGSGTTAIACHSLNRNFICIEKDIDYYNLSTKRLQEHKQQLRLF